MLRTAFTNLIGCTVPIQLAPIPLIATIPLAAAVADAGGLGMIGAPMLPPPVLQSMLEELRTALHAVDGDIRAACPRGTPATLPERLRIMQDRLWALRVTAVNLRAPLQKFQDALTPEQRAKLGEPQTAARENQQSAAGDEGGTAIEAELGPGGVFGGALWALHAEGLM